MKRIWTLLLALCLPIWAAAQDGDLLLNDETYHLLDRIDIKGLTDKPVPTDFKPLGREQVVDILRDVNLSGLGERQLKWIDRARNLLDDDYATDRSRGILKFFYRNRRDFLHFKNDKVKVYLNPMLYLSGGVDRYSAGGSSSDATALYRNSRGASLRASLFNRVGVYADILDNQAIYPQFINNTYNQLNTLWGESFVKPYGSKGYDYLYARGYITFSPIKQIRVKFGKDRAFVGNGFQSLFLSDNAADQLMLNITTRFWKFEYVCHYTQMVDYIPNKPDSYGAYPRKWGALHQLSYRPIKELSISLFESTIYAAHQPNGSRGFEIQYLNPVIFYRAAEQFVGSPDNTFLGLQVKGNIWKRFQVYGQLLIDDYNFAQRKSGSGWWGNKFGYQLGVKYVDVLGVETLDLQAEYNRVRPYTYAHYNTSSNYSNYGQYLAHASGANLQDFNIIARYQPIPRLNLYAAFYMLWQGLDKNGLNYGSNIFLTNNTHNNGQADPDFDNKVGQGDLNFLKSFNARISYQLFTLNWYVDLELWARTDNYYTSTSFMASLRLNIPHKPVRF